MRLNLELLSNDLRSQRCRWTITGSWSAGWPRQQPDAHEAEANYGLAPFERHIAAQLVRQDAGRQSDSMAIQLWHACDGGLLGCLELIQIEQAPLVHVREAF